MTAKNNSVACASTRGQASFPRGVHPAESKELAENAAIEVLPTPASVRIPVLQHLGKPAKVTAKPRASVALNDAIGDADGFISAGIHASISGETARAGVTTLANGRHVPTVPIKAAEEQPLEGQALYDAMIGGEWPVTGLEQYEPKAIFAAAQEAGIVGQGGATFPTHVKLMKNDEKPVEAILLNGCECEPYLTADYRMMVEAPASIVCGALLAQIANGARRVVVCIEDNKPEAIQAMRKAADGTCVEVLSMKTKYPQGGEKQLVLAALGKAVPNGGLPLDVGAVVMNVGTATALARKVVRGYNLTHRIVTVTGRGITTPKNVLAPVGVTFQQLVDFCGGLNADAARVVSGGPMMGFAVGSLESIVTKGTSGITVMTADEIAKADETNCVRCGRCVDVCPLNLVPTKLALASRNNMPEVASRYHINVCMECGCCAYTCPASIPLVQLIRVGKVQVRNMAAK
jgi:electron transport complex protein RnfC